MDNEKRIVGFLYKDSDEFAFEFDEESFELKLYAKSFEQSSRINLNRFAHYIMNDEAENKWVENIELKGKTSTGEYIIFGMVDTPDNHHGFLTYKIKWAFISRDETFEFDKVGIRGEDVNNFFNPWTTFSQNVDRDEDGRILGEMTILAKRSEKYIGGTYNVDGYQVCINAIAYPKRFFYSNKPFESESFLYLEFSKRIGYDAVKNRVSAAIHFLQYVTYRKKISINTIDLWLADKKTGELLIPYTPKDTYSDACHKIIKSFNLNEKAADIFEKIENNEIHFNHLCPDIKSRKHYSLPRFIMILSRFEREFHNIYTENMQVSPTRSSMNALVVTLLNDLKCRYCFSKKQNKHLDSIIKLVENSDMAYAQYVKKALLDCKGAMESFVCGKYTGIYEDIVEDVSERLNTLRNGVAHERLDLEIKVEYMSDIKILEALIYAIRLKDVGIEDKTILNCVSNIID